MEIVTNKANYSIKIDSSEAFVHMVVASIYDSSGLTVSKKSEVLSCLSRKKYLTHLPLEELIDLSVILCRDLGRREVIEQSVDHLSDEVKMSLFAICLDLIVCNGHFDESELRFMIELGGKLGVGFDDAVRMIDLFCIKNYGNRYTD
jgi:arginine decarboxylase-like protein